ncbi:hypothetical protein [Maritalea sp.]|uniref:hypothetical protein n=1 Tax=Maritalea sp. TaxID=2003361 RepID=UPI003EF37D92
MNFLSNILLMIHLFSMCLGIGIGVAVVVAGTQIQDVSSDAGRAILGLVKKLSALGRMAIVLLWLTGIFMFLLSYSNLSSLGWTFVVKITFVILLTISVFYAKTLGPKIAAGDKSARVLGKKIGILNGGLATLALIFAVLTFSA